MSRPLLALLSLSFIAATSCARRVPADPADSLDGLELALRSAGGIRMAVAGEVDGIDAEVSLEVSQPRTTVSAACFSRPPDSDTTVRFQLPSGGFEKAAETTLAHARIGTRRLGEVRAALTDEETCRLTLGSDVLAPWALSVDPSTRTLRITPTRPRAAWLAEASAASGRQDSGEELHVLELLRDPSADWPLLAVRARQGQATLTGAFVLATSAPESFVDTAIATQSGLQKGPELLRDLGFPPKVELPRAIAGSLYTLEGLDLAPGFGLQFAALRAADDWQNEGAVGLIGGDVWGHFVTTVDVSAGVLALRRPRVVASGPRQSCEGAAGSPASAENCFVLHQQPTARGVDFVASVWRDLPKGARIDLDLFDQKGEPVGGLCRVGLSFGRADRGASSAHALPWEGLRKKLPDCAEALSHAAEVRFSLLEESPLGECPGNCAFVRDAAQRHVSCECERSGAGAMSEAERRFLEIYQELLQHGGHPSLSPQTGEPQDPE